MTSPTNPFSPGERIGDYKILEPLGQGGAARVFKVQHELTKRIEAMKIIAVRQGATEEQAQHLLREVELQASLDHPNIAKVYNAMWVGDRLVTILELIDGEPLDRVMARGRLPLPRAVQFAGDILAALEYAHTRGVLHRDISPRNLMVAAGGGIKVTDFGLASAPGEPAGGVPTGTLSYASPEQIRARESADPRSDLYSAGAVLYEMAAGRPPFDRPSDFAVMVAQVEEAPAPPRSIQASIPESLDAVILRALEKDPARRFQSAAEFRQALSAVPVSRKWLKAAVLGTAAAFFTAIAGAGAWYAYSVTHLPPQHLDVGAARADIPSVRLDTTAAGAVETPKPVPPPKAAEKKEVPAEPAPVPSAAELARSAGATPSPVTPAPVSAPKVVPPKVVELPAGAYQQIKSLPVASTLMAPVFSPDARWVAVPAGDSIEVFNAASGERSTLGPQGGAVTSFVFSRDGSRLVSAGRDGSVKVWDIASRSLIRSIAAKSAVTAVAFSRDQQWVAAATADKKLRAWSLERSNEAHELKDIKGDLAAVAFTPDGRGLAAASLDRVIRLWTIDKSKPRLRFDGWDEGATSLAFSPGGERLAAASGDRVKTFDILSGRELTHVQVIGTARSLVYTADDRCLAVSSGGSSVRLWDIDKARQIREVAAPGPVLGIGLAANGRRFAAISGSTLTIWEGRP